MSAIAFASGRTAHTRESSSEVLALWTEMAGVARGLDVAITVHDSATGVEVAVQTRHIETVTDK